MLTQLGLRLAQCRPIVPGGVSTSVAFYRNWSVSSALEFAAWRGSGCCLPRFIFVISSTSLTAFVP